jgi:chitinase
MAIHHRLPTSLALAVVGLAAFLPLAQGQATAANPLPKRLVADYGYWSRTQTPPYSSDQIPFKKLTHINHAGVSFGADGSLTIPAGFLEPELIEKAHAAGVKVLLLLGGDFGALVATPALVDTLVDNLRKFIVGHAYDGLDIDWEYPATTADRKTFHQVMTELREAFPSPHYVLSADVPPRGRVRI